MTFYRAGTDIPIDFAALIGSPAPCILCQAPGLVCSLFEPDDPWEWSALAPCPGRKRMIAYALCRAHQPPTDEIIARVEAVIRRMVGK